jgi:hypothetical protein
VIEEKFNRAVLTGLIRAMSEVHSGTAEEADKCGRAIITAAAKGEIPHLTINYAASEVKEGALL